jgi:UDP-N-acetylmuramoylalanine-D-glutamate ligase
MLVCVGNGSAALHQAFASVVPAVVDVPDIAAAVQVASRCPVQGAKVIYSPATAAGGAVATEAKTFIHQVNEL